MVDAYMDGEIWTEARFLERIWDYSVPERYWRMFFDTHHVTLGHDSLVDRILSHDVEKFNIFFRHLNERERLVEELRDKTNMTINVGAENNIEISNPTTNKGNSLAILCNRLDIKKDEVMAIGDSSNDVDMLKFSGLGIAMGNSSDALKDVSDYVVKSNDEAGVAEALERFILNA